MECCSATRRITLPSIDVYFHNVRIFFGREILVGQVFGRISTAGNGNIFSSHLRCKIITSSEQQFYIAIAQ